MEVFDNANPHDELLKKLMLRQSLAGGGMYGKPIIGNEQSAGVARTISDAGMTFFGGKPKNDENDILSKLYLMNYKAGLDTPDGYGSESEVPQEMGGLPLKGMTLKNGRYIPSYGKPTMLGFDMNAYDDEPDADGEDGYVAMPEQAKQPEQQSPTLNELELAYKKALSDPTKDRAEVEKVYQAEKSRLSSAQTGADRFEGDISEFDIDDSDKQYLIDQGFTPDDVELALGSAMRRKQGGGA